MYRPASTRLVRGAILWQNRNASLRLARLLTINDYSLFSTVTNSQSFVSNESPNPDLVFRTSNFSDSTSSASSSSSSSSSSSTGSAASSALEEARRHESRRPRTDYQEEQARFLQASLLHVIKLGWTEAAMIAGARDSGVSPTIVGSLPRKEAALIEFFMDDCLQRLIEKIDLDGDLKKLITSERIFKLVKTRLEMQVPFISKWPQALGIQSRPMNVPISFKQRAMLVDEIWHAAGDDTADLDWYVKCTILGGIYSSTEIYMLTDSSPGFKDTWSFLDHRVKDAFDLKKSIQEAQYLAEAVGVGMGNSFEGFVKRVFKARGL